MRWQDDPVVGVGWQDDPIVEEEPVNATKSSVLDAIKRQGGLGLRNAAQGLASVPGVFLDPFQQLVGMPTISGATNRLLTKAGLPEEVTDYEKLAGSGTRAITGGAGFAKAAQAIPAALKMAPEVVNNIMAQKPLAQMFQAGVGGMAGEGTRQAGGNEWLQLLASATAPMAATGAVGAAQAAGRGAAEALRPLRQKGAEQIAADVLGRLAQDKVRAIANIEASVANKATPNAVPGYATTAGAASKDAGLIGAEQVRVGDAAFAPDFVPLFGRNNAALTDDLRSLRANAEKLSRWKEIREKTTGPMREDAFNNAKGPVNYGPVAQKIIQIAGTAEGGAVESQKALQWLTDRLGWYAKEGRFDARNAYELEKDIGKLVAGKVEDPKLGRLKLAGGLANDVRKELVDQISAVAPGFDKYLQTYGDLSKSINRLEIVTNALGDRSLQKVTNSKRSLNDSGPLTTTQRTVSADKVGNAIPRIEAALQKKRLPDLTDYQKRVLGRVDNALNEQSAAATAGKPPGSDTFRNLSGSNLFDAILGAEAAGALVPQWITKPVGMLYGKTVEPRIQDIITEAFLNEKKMAELLRKARTQRKSITWDDLATTAEQNVYGGLLGGTLAR
jgi:hypothetical protein